MKAQVTNIRFTERTGAYGNPNALYVAVYGKRPDGLTVQCETEWNANCIRIYSIYKPKGSQAHAVAETELSEEEWRLFQQFPRRAQPAFTTEWLESREDGQFSQYQLEVLQSWRQGRDNLRATLRKWGVLSDGGPLPSDAP